MQRQGYIASVPLWELFALTGVLSVVGVFINRAWKRTNAWWLFHARTAQQALTVTLTIYAIGWGPVLAVGYVFIVQDGLCEGGARAWRPLMLWTLVGMAFGQAAIATGAAHSFVPAPQVHGVAVLALLGLLSAVRLLALNHDRVAEVERSLRAREER